MNKNACVATLIAFSFSTAHAAEACPEYIASSGIEIQFKTDDLYKNGFPMFWSAPEALKSTPSYEALAGKKGKVIGKASGGTRILKYHEVLLEDCTRTYWHDPDGNLDPSDARVSGVNFLQQPLTNWTVREKVDPMTDAKSCSITAQGRKPFPMFLYHSQAGFSIAAHGGDFPGRPVTVRIDSNKAISGDESISGANAQAVVNQMRAGGNSILISAYEWPNDYQAVSDSFNLSGLMEKLDYCKSWVRM